MILKILTIIQARTSSTRLQNKVMLSLCDKPLLLRMYERVSYAYNTGTIVIATTENKEDDKIEELCVKEKIECFRGHPTDLLDRHYKTAIKYDADVIIKIPSDCPLIDPLVIDKVINYYLNNIDKFDYVSNLHPPSYPDGNDVEIMTFDALKIMWKEAMLEHQREHTTPFIWENPSKFEIGNVFWETGLDYSKTHRWTIDYQEDYNFIKLVFEELYHKNPKFGINDILSLLNKKPYIKNINSLHKGKFWYNNLKVNNNSRLSFL